MLDPLSDDAKRERFDAGDRLRSRCAVNDDSRKVGDVGDPATIVFAFGLDAHFSNLTFNAAARQPEPHAVASRYTSV